MPMEMSPLGSQPPGLKPTTGVTPDKQGGGQGGGRQKKGEPEPVEEEIEEEAQLSSDSLATHRQAANLGEFPDQMPWELTAEMRKQRLEELARKRETGPKAVPPGTSKLSLPGGPARPRVGTQNPAGPTPSVSRRLEAGWDPNAAAANTLMAHNNLREQQEERERQRREQELARRPQLPSSGAPSFEPLIAPKPLDETPPEPLFPVPAAEQVPSQPGELPSAPQSPPQRPAVPAARRQTGELLPRRNSELPAMPPSVPQPPAAPPQALEQRIAAAPARPAARYRCMYQVLDGATRQPIAGARLEFEPTHDALLPVTNGVADEWGVYCSNDPPPGYYQVTVRFPGFMPMAQTRYIVEGETDEGTFLIRRP